MAAVYTEGADDWRPQPTVRLEAPFEVLFTGPAKPLG